MFLLNTKPRSFSERVDLLQWKTGGQRAILARYVEREMAAEAAWEAWEAEERREAEEFASIYRDLLTLYRMLRETKGQ